MAGSSKRERELARERYARQQKNREEARRKARRRAQVVTAALVVVAVVGGYVGLGALLGDDDPAENASAQSPPSPDASQSPSAAPAGNKVCSPAGSAAPKKQSFPKEPARTVDVTKTYLMSLQTNCGTVEIQLDAAKAPRTVNSFNFLAGKNYFDNTKCHRLTTEGIFVLQCGDPTATGSGGPGYQFADENLTGAKYPAGTVAMANSGPNTNGSQFFLVYKQTELPPKYTPFGKITKGLDVVEKVAKEGVAEGGGDGAPKETVVLQKVTVAPSAG